MSLTDTHIRIKIPSAMKWSPDGSGLAYQVSGPAGNDLRLYCPGAGTDHPLLDGFPPFRLYRQLPDIRWLPDGRQLFVKTGFGYHRLEISGAGQAEVMPVIAEDAELAQLAPDLGSVCFIREGDLWMQPVGEVEARRLTNGEGLLTSDWQLFSRLRQFPQWSPDSTRIAYVSPYHQGSLVRIVDLSGGITEIIPEEDQWALSTMTWSPDSRRLAIAWLSNDLCQKALTVHSIDDGTKISLWTDSDEKWVDHTIHAGFDAAWSHDGKQLAFLSNRSGWRHLYMGSTASGKVKQVTSGEYEVSWCSWSPDGSRLAFISSREELQARSLWMMNADGSEPTLLLKGGLVTGGWFLRQVNLEWSPDGKQIACVQSGSRQMPALVVVDVSAPEKILTAYSSLPQDAGADLAMAIEPVNFPAGDGLELRAALLTAPGIERTKPNPALVFAYGAWDMEAQLGWEYGPKNLLFNYLTQRGYVILIVDPRGSEGYGDGYSKGQYHEGGRRQVDDLTAGAAFLANLGWVDKDRIALFGYSYGGYMVLQTMQRKPGVFAAGISMAPVTEWNAYAGGSAYANARFGTPDMVPNPLVENSPLYSVDRLEGNLLILHGNKDFNVPIVFSEMYVTALMKYSKIFEYMVYPNEGHVWTREETIRDFLTRIARFLDHSMKG